MKPHPVALRAAFFSPLLALTLAPPAAAQTYRDSGGTVVPGMVIVDPSGVGPLGTSANPMKISGSFAATLSGFTPTPSYASLSIAAVNTSYNVALPSGTVIVVYNTGSYDAYVKLGVSSVTASPSNDVVKAGGWMAFTVGSNTYLAGYSTAGATTLNISGGVGLPTGSGGSGSGGGGSVPTGSAGSPNASVVTVQGVLGGTVVPENQTQIAGTALGAPTAWGTAPSGNVQGVNANVVAATPIQTTPKSGSFSIAGCTVGTTSAQCLGAGTYNHVQIQNTSTSASIACSWGATAALNSSGSIQLAAGQSALWGPTTSGVPSTALNCIAGSASTPLYVEAN